MVERLIHDHGFSKLKNNKIYTRFSQQVNAVITDLLNLLGDIKNQDDSLSGIKDLINNIHTILSDERKNHALWEIVCDLIDSDLDEKENHWFQEKIDSTWRFFKSLVKV